MNRIILIGNGFDLAHGLKTSYKNFIDHVWRNKIKNIIEKETFVDVDKDLKFDKANIHKKDWSFGRLSECNCHKSLKEHLELWDQGFYITNSFLKKITENLDLDSTRWVDVEKQYYISLKGCLLDRPDVFGIPYDKYKLEQLNKEFKLMKTWLIEYLKGQRVSIMDDLHGVANKIASNFMFRDFTQEYKKKFIEEKIKLSTSIVNGELEYSPHTDKKIKEIFKNAIYTHVNMREMNEFIYSNDGAYYFEDLNPNDILLLNFNYTSNHDIYHKDIKESMKREKWNLYPNLKHINIHGDLNNDKNPVIFGFGDEFDKSFSAIEDLEENEFLENIKSTRYHDTSNYKELLEYIDSDYYQVCIFGHSCGLSDRTMLSTLFNHDNCVSIKPYYHKKDDGTDNYSDLVRNISRHFTDKASLRDKVVNKEYCMPLVGSK